MNVARASSEARSDADTVAALLCVDPGGLGGVVLRTGAGPRRDAWLRHVRTLLPAGSPLRHMPLHIHDDRLLGTLDLVATLAAGRPVAQQGLLVESDGGIVMLSMAERMATRTAAHIAAAIDTQAVLFERHGLCVRRSACIGVIAMDEGIALDECAPGRLVDRLALRLEELPPADAYAAGAWTQSDVAAARTLLAAVEIDDATSESLCAAAIALEIASLRGSILAIRCARAHAALNGRSAVAQADAALAARLVLLPRAAVMFDDAPQPPQAESNPADQEERPADQEDTEPGAASASADDDVVLETAAAVLPSGLLELLKTGRSARARLRSEGRSGVPVAGGLRGRPDRVLHGNPREGRLNLMETLRAAAPWQALRRQAMAASDEFGGIRVHREDFRITRFKQRSETTTLFAVDASGSAALHRLGEAKGAVELLLADCYARRDSVSLIAFRGSRAEVLLEPTRSLVRAKRCLAGLAGGGGTPLATAIDATLSLAEATRRRGRTPVAVLLTDGCANVALDGSGGRQRAGEEALQSARRLRAAGVKALVLDTSPQPQEAGRTLAEHMGAVYLPLPHADAALLSSVVRSAGGLGP